MEALIIVLITIATAFTTTFLFTNFLIDLKMKPLHILFYVLYVSIAIGFIGGAIMALLINVNIVFILMGLAVIAGSFGTIFAC